MDQKPRFRLSVDIPEITRLFVMDYFEWSVPYHILYVFHGREASALKVWSAELMVLLRDEQGRLLKAAGFGDVDFYGWSNFSPYDREGSDRLVTVAHRYPIRHERAQTHFLATNINSL